MINSNLVHNVMNTLGWVGGSAATLATFFGCQDFGSQMNCSGSWVPPSWIPYIMAAGTLMFFSKQIMNLLRDGFAGLAAEQPPVVRRPKGRRGKPQEV